MTNIILIRHGQSEANLHGIFAGHSHYSLSDMGKEQAKRTAEYVAKTYKIDKIYSSDLLRAFYTAVFLSDKLDIMPITTDVGLRELYAGDWEGLTWQQIADFYPEQTLLWQEKIHLCEPENGEALADLAHRAVKTVLRLAAENDGKTIALASHATFIRALESVAKYGTADKMPDVPWPTNASVSLYSCENGKIHANVFSYDEHLQEIRQAKIMEG